MRHFFHIFKNQNATTNDVLKRTIEAVTEIWLNRKFLWKVIGCIQNNFWKFLNRGKNPWLMLSEEATIMKANDREVMICEKAFSVSYTWIRALDYHIFLESCTDMVWLEAWMRLLEHGLNSSPLASDSEWEEESCKKLGSWYAYLFCQIGLVLIWDFDFLTFSLPFFSWFMIESGHLHFASVSLVVQKSHNFLFSFSVLWRSPEICCSTFLAVRSFNVSKLSQNLFLLFLSVLLSRFYFLKKFSII